ncbi:MAG: hypothetical protein WAM91_11005 [Candidatus Acidiferrales bacterium]
MSTKKATPDQRKHHITRCTFVTPANRRCKMAVMPGRSRTGERNVFCAFHAKQEMQVYDAKAVSREILGPLDDVRSACAINRVLGKLFIVTVEDRIPIRNAAVLAAIAQLMLRTLQPLRKELLEAGGQHGLDAILRDVFALLDDTMSKDKPAPPGKVKEHWRDEIEDSLAVLRRAGYALPTAGYKKRESANNENEGDENEEDDNGDRDNAEIENGEDAEQYEYNPDPRPVP